MEVSNMSITIKRNTGWQGMGTRIQILVNGEKVASVSGKQQVEIELPDNKAHLKVTQTGIKSNEIEVQDGDIIEITQTRLHRMSFPLMMVIMFFTIFIPSLTYRFIATISLGGLLTISLFITDGFYLKVLKEDINGEIYSIKK